MSLAWLELVRANAGLGAVGAALAGAALCAAFGGARASAAIAIAALAICLVLTTDLAWRTLLAGAPDAEAGHLGLTAFFAPLVSAGGLFSAAAGAALFVRECGVRAAPFAFALLLVMTAGWLGVVFAGDLIGLFAAIEAGWLASVALAALSAQRSRGALSGAYRMLIGGALGAAFVLFGLAVMAAAAGSSSFSALSEVAQGQSATLGLGAGFVLIGLGLKAGLAPLHDWVGPVWGRAGAASLMGIASVGVVGALAVLARIAAPLMSAPGAAEYMGAALTGLGVASIVIASVQAIGASHAGRLVGYALGAQAGCFLVCLGLSSRAGIEAALAQATTLQAAILGLMGGLAALGSVSALPSLDGAVRRSPLAAVSITAAMLALMGAPLTIGFLARWRLIEAGLGGGWWIAVGAAVGASLTGLLYGGRILERVLFRRAEAAPTMARAQLLGVAPAMLAGLLVIAGAGLYPHAILRAAHAAAELAMGAAP